MPDSIDDPLDERAAELLEQAHEVADPGTIGRLDQALKHLREVSGVDFLVSHLPREVVGLGYHRALFSWVDQMRWVAQSAYSLSGPEESEQLIRAGREKPYVDLARLNEREAIHRRETILWTGIRDSDRVHPRLIRVTQSDSYIASPLVANNGVVGFIHLDLRADGNPVTAEDRAMISLFCEAAGFALQRARAVEEANALRAFMRQTTTPLHEVPRQLAHDPMTLPLTRREAEVLELVARGMTNAQIGERLFVTEGTVKTHVKSLLRKLGVQNRTEAANVFRT